MNSLLEEVVLRKTIKIKGTNIILLGDIDSLKDSNIQNIKEVVDFLMDNNGITSEFITVENEWQWKTVRIAEGIPNEDNEAVNYSFYQIFTNKKEFLKEICEMTEFEFLTVKEMLEDLSNEAFKIRKGLYLANIDAYYQ